MIKYTYFAKVSLSLSLSLFDKEMSCVKLKRKSKKKHCERGEHAKKVWVPKFRKLKNSKNLIKRMRLKLKRKSKKRKRHFPYSVERESASPHHRQLFVVRPMRMSHWCGVREVREKATSSLGKKQGERGGGGGFVY